MPNRILRYNLMQDTVDRDPSIPIAHSGGIYTATNQVPPYLYKSLSTLWYGSSGIGNLDRDVVADLGTGRTYSGGSIVIYTDRSVPSSQDYQGFRSDAFGWESAYLRIVLEKPTTMRDANNLLYVAQRIAYDLDHTARGMRGLKPGLSYPPTSFGEIDTSIIDPATGIAPFMCRYDGTEYATTASRFTVRFHVQYARFFCP